MFKQGAGDWTKYRELHPVEIDFHYSNRDRDEEGYVPGSARRRRKHEEPPPMPYHAMMEEVWATALSALQAAQKGGVRYVLFQHGWSTSVLGSNTARSQVRDLMRSAEAAPYIISGECIEHNSVFLAAIRPPPADCASAGTPPPASEPEDDLPEDSHETPDADSSASDDQEARPKDKKLSVEPLAAEIADLIANGKQDSRLKWFSDGKVQVLIGIVIPATNSLTTGERRKRFRRTLNRLLAPNWEESRANVYRRV